MQEYRINIKVKNNLLLSFIEKEGYKSIAEFSRASNISQSTLGDFLNFKSSPLNLDGTFCKAAQNLMNFLGALPEDLWSEEQLTMRLKTNSAFVNMDCREMMLLMDRTATGVIEYEDPDVCLNRKKITEKVQTLLNNLTPITKEILMLRSDGKTLEEIAKIYNVSKERVRQIESKGHRILRTKIQKAKLDDKMLIQNLQEEAGLVDNSWNTKLSDENKSRIQRIKEGKHPDEQQNK